MKKGTVLTAAASLSATLILLIGSTTAYFTDIEVKDNIITIGKIDLQLDEGNFPPDTVAIVPGSKVDKAPKLKNTGNRDEFVFLKIAVPKKQVTLLNSSGTPIDNLSGSQQIFRIIANESLPMETISTQAGKDIDFSYHGINNSGTSGSVLGGWVLLKRTETENEYDEYVFGYNRKLSPNGETSTLFDAVQLKSFIDGETSRTVAVNVYGFGIQADNLKTSGTIDYTQTEYSLSDLQAIYTIVENKYNAKSGGSGS